MNDVLNFHFTDICNFACGHCFIVRENRELTIEQCKKVVDKAAELGRFERINLAGGEPMMSPHLQELIDYIVSKNLKCSLITNGSLLSIEFVNLNRNKLSMIGISVDSLDENMNELIGRKTLNNLSDICDAIKKAKITLKINICINEHNVDYDFIPLIELTKPDRLKILQVMPTQNALERGIHSITSEQFSSVCKKLEKYKPVIESEEYMKEAYYIVDSEGYFGKDNLHMHNKDEIKFIDS